MKTKFLFPRRFKKIGLVLLALAVICLFIPEISFLKSVKMLSINLHGHIDFLNSSDNEGLFRIIRTDLQLTIWCIIAIAGLLFVAFSRLKSEDEYITRIRFESLAWSTYLNFILLAIATILTYETDFLEILFYNMFSVLIFFIFRFHYVLYKSSKQVSHEK